MKKMNKMNIAVYIRALTLICCNVFRIVTKNIQTDVAKGLKYTGFTAGYLGLGYACFNMYRDFRADNKYL